MVSTLNKPITADELFAMKDLGRCELVHGELIMMSPAGFEHGDVTMRIAGILAGFVEDHDLGSVLAADTGFIIDEHTVRGPNVSLVCKDRVPPLPYEKLFPCVPDLAVEVTLSGDTKREVMDKTNMWLAHGTAVVWVAEPRLMSLTIHRVGQEPQRLIASDQIQDEPLLPDFILPLAKVFRLP